FDSRYRFAEVSRWVIAAEHRGRITSRTVYLKCWEVAAELGFDYVVSEAKYKAKALHKRIGFQEYSAPYHDPDMHIQGDPENAPNAIVMRAKVSSLINKHSGLKKALPENAASRLAQVM
ncbi:MAG: hypothetical protein MI867_03310, partial [Pseudomonadales bacterium]|nr:hypothetical protein [Pseudomonadales bacterium]